MEAELKRLLAIEEEAERLVADAEEDQRNVVATARTEAQELERSFAQDAELIRDRHMQKAEAKATQAITELRRHYEERDAQLRAAAETYQDAALHQALRLFGVAGD